MQALDVALLLIRLSGAAMAAHGAQKLFGWFGGQGVAGTGAVFEKLGFRPGRLFAFAAGAGETGGGLLTLLGLGGSLGPALIVLVMVVAALSVHVKNGFFQSNRGWEMNMLYVAVAIALGYVGPGSLSIDGSLGLDVLHDPRQVTWSFVAAVVLALLNLAARRKTPAAVTP